MPFTDRVDLDTAVDEMDEGFHRLWERCISWEEHESWKAHSIDDAVGEGVISELDSAELIHGGLGGE